MHGVNMDTSINYEQLNNTVMMDSASRPSDSVIDSFINTSPCETDTLTTYYECSVCKKTFYNAIALQNHKKLQHDIYCPFSETEQKTITSRQEDVLEEYFDFKFVPLKISVDSEGTTTTVNGITKRTFDVDTSYIIVKVEGDDDVSLKRSKLDGGLRRTQLKTTKPSVDLRGPFTCTLPSLYRPDLLCHQIFFNCCDYSLHYREKHTKRRKAALRCQVCEKRLDRDVSTLQAKFSVLNNIKLPCRLCGQVFMDSIHYDEHIRTVHTKLKPHQCSICSKRFTQQGGLQQHMRMHTGIRPFICNFCNKAFTQKAGLDQHLRTHTKVKPFKCIICGKCFSQSVHLRQHMRTHTNIQPFECPFCGRRFKQSSHLNFHMRSHSEEANGLIDEQYAQAVSEQDSIDFLNLENVQPVRDGETMYYAAELSSLPPAYQNSMVLDPQVMFFNNDINK